MADVLALGFAFYIIAPIFFIILLFMSDRENWGGTIIVSLIGLALLQFVSEVKPFTYLWQNPKELLLIILMYLPVGVVWAYIKWTSYVSDKGRKLKAFHRKALIEYEAKDGEIPKDRLLDFGNRAYNHLYGGHAFYSENLTMEEVKERLVPIANKSETIYWICWWPLSLIWTLFDDPLRRLLNAIYNGIRESLANIAKRKFDKIDI